MKKRDVLAIMSTVVMALVGAVRGETPRVYHQTDVLGTSLDCAILASSKGEADAAFKAVTDEIERLRKIMSTYDATTEISKLNETSETMTVSPELAELLAAYQTWNKKTGNAHNGQMGDLIKLYKEAEKNGKLPTAEELAPIVKALALPAVAVDGEKHTARRLTGNRLNVDALGKAYVIGKAVAAARVKVPGLQGIMLNIGGDILTWSDPKVQPPAVWKVAVANPANPAENAAPVTELAMRDGAVVTSGSYARFYTIGGKKYSHILDPRTGKPEEGVASATVVAKDAVTANALATTLCVVTPTEGLKLAKAEGAECLIITSDGRQIRSDNFKSYEAAGNFKVAATQGATTQGAETKPAAGSGDAWPAGNKVTIDIDITPQGGRRGGGKRPFVCVWVTDAKGDHVKTIAVWGGVGKEAKYLRDMVDWWKIAKNDPDLVKTSTRATRQAGKYTLDWDGTDQKGKAVAPGTYTVHLETAVEDGPHASKAGTIVCGKDVATGTIEKSTAFGEGTLKYGAGK